MKEYYRKYAEDYLRKKLEQKQVQLSDGVSVIAPTNKSHTLNNIIANFDRQDFQKKELIIIINKDDIDLNLWLERTKDYDNIRIFKLSEKISLGECLNFAVEKSKYETIARFDDDDYYGPKYLSNMIEAYYISGAEVIVKAAHFVYFVEKKILAITKDKENKFVLGGGGSTITFKKEIFNRVKFKDISLGEDEYFCQDCIKNNIRIYSTNKYHYICFRHPSKENHTWKINDDKLINWRCQVIGQVNDYISYANNPGKKEGYSERIL